MSLFTDREDTTTVCLSHHLPFSALSHFSSIFHSSASLPFFLCVCLSSTLLSLLPLHCWNNHQLPLSLCVILLSISLHLPSPSSEWFLLVGCGPPNPVPVSHPAPGSWEETDSSMSKSIIIFSQCNPIPEDIPERTHSFLVLLTVSHVLISIFSVAMQKWGGSGKTEGEAECDVDKQAKLWENQDVLCVHSLQHTSLFCVLIHGNTRIHAGRLTPSCPDCHWG